MPDKLLTRRNLILASVAGAVGFGAAGWLLLGSLWAIAGVLAGPFIPPVGYAVAMAFFLPAPVTLIQRGRPEDALRQLRRSEPSDRQMARVWPSQFRDMLAYNLTGQSDALHAMHRDREALRAAEEGVAIYQALAADKPAKYGACLSRSIDTRARALAGAGRHGEAIDAIGTAIRMFRNLAMAEPGEYLPVMAEALTCKAEWLAEIDNNTEALAAASEATGIYWNKLPAAELCVHAARAALLEGRLLCQQSRYHDAARLLARGWTLAVRQQQHNALSAATPALKIAYRATPDAFVEIWHAETGSKPPDWLAC